MFTKENFWKNTQGVFPIIGEGSFYDLIVISINTYHNFPGFEVNFNDASTVFFVRTNEFAIRVSRRWGEVGSCKWDLNRDTNPYDLGQVYQMVRIDYDKLNIYEQGK